MSTHVVARIYKYKVDPSKDVVLRVTIGDAQGGGWLVAWGPDAIVAKGADPDPVPLGPGKDLIGKILQVAVTAVDVQPATNNLSRVLKFTGGAAKSFVDAYTTGNAGDSCVFATLVEFE